VLVSSTKPITSVAQPGLGLEHGGDVLALGVGPGHDHLPGHAAPGAQPGEQAPGDLALEGDQDHGAQGQHHPAGPAEQDVGQARGHGDAQRAEEGGVDDPVDLVDAAADEARVVEPLAREQGDPDRHGGDGGPEELPAGLRRPRVPAVEEQGGDGTGEHHGDAVGHREQQLGPRRAVGPVDRGAGGLEDAWRDDRHRLGVVNHHPGASAIDRLVVQVSARLPVHCYVA
jgi:hypothetical protein